MKKIVDVGTVLYLSAEDLNKIGIRRLVNKETISMVDFNKGVFEEIQMSNIVIFRHEDIVQLLKSRW